MLLHDFPEFLCDYYLSFCDVIPSTCVQLRNLILSAFPRSMRLPDPFTPNLKVNFSVPLSLPSAFSYPSFVSLQDLIHSFIRDWKHLSLNLVWMRYQVTQHYTLSNPRQCTAQHSQHISLITLTLQHDDRWTFSQRSPSRPGCSLTTWQRSVREELDRDWTHTSPPSSLRTCHLFCPPPLFYPPLPAHPRIRTTFL